MKAVVASGTISMSLSSIDCQPRIEEPSKPRPSSKMSSSSMPIGKEEFVERVLQREQEESTCLGEGFMIPHGTLEEDGQVRGVLGLSAEGMDLGAPDGREVHAVVLLATPEVERERHLEILAAFASAITRHGNLREQLYAARSAAHAYEILHADEREDINYFLDEAIQEASADR